jgi:acyl-CoA synthetase (AMP-forming)/AMP-acid ligase II
VNVNAAAPFIDILSNDPGRTAIVEPDGQSVSRGGLLCRIVGMADMLLDLGFEPGDRVLIQVPKGMRFAAATLGVLLAGGVPVLIEPGMGDDVYLSRVHAAKPSWLLIDPMVLKVQTFPIARKLLSRMEIDVPPLPAAETGMRRVLMSRHLCDGVKNYAGDPTAFKPIERDPDDDAIMVFTGGTTSKPKGVRLAHRALGPFVENISHAVHDLPIHHFLADTPQQVLYALMLGKTAYVTKGRAAKRAETVLKLIRSKKVDAYFGSPYIWMEIAHKYRGKLPQLPDTLQSVMLGGAPVTREFLKMLRDWLPEKTRIVVIYGMTEAGPVCSVTAREKLAFDGEGDLVGRPLGEMTVETIAGKDTGDAGEVIVKGPSLFSGYLEDTPRGKDEGFAAGDLGRIVTVNGENMLALLGRKKDMILRNGVNIYPATFEETIALYADGRDQRPLREAALVGLWNEERQDEDVALCLEPGPNAKLDLAAVRKYVDKICGPAVSPDHILVVDPFPVTGRLNKVDKVALRKICREKLGLPPSTITTGV